MAAAVALLSRWSSRQVCLYNGKAAQRVAAAAAFTRSTTAAAGGGRVDNFFDKNRKLGRPTSPHLSILLRNPELTSMMSITHRITGMVLAIDVSALVALWLASGSSWTDMVLYYQSLQLPAALIFTEKFMLAFPFTYHTCNGVRHLCWDTGKGFELKTLYRSGYAVLLISLLSAIGLALYTPAAQL